MTKMLLKTVLVGLPFLVSTLALLFTLNPGMIILCLLTWYPLERALEECSHRNTEGNGINVRSRRTGRD